MFNKEEWTEKELREEHYERITQRHNQSIEDKLAGKPYEDLNELIKENEEWHNTRGKWFSR